MTSQDRTDELVRAARQAGGTVTTHEIEQAGFSRNDLYALRDLGDFVELSRGVYRLSDSPAIAHLDFVAVSKRAPGGTICLDSALSRWDLTDVVPGEVHLAVAKGATRPSIANPRTAVHVFAAETFEVDRVEEILSTSERYWIYSAERSVVDALRMRQRFGGGPGLDALRNYLSRPKASRRRLVELARKLNVESSLLQALEILG